MKWKIVDILTETQKGIKLMMEYTKQEQVTMKKNQEELLEMKTVTVK